MAMDREEKANELRTKKSNVSSNAKEEKQKTNVGIKDHIADFLGNICSAYLDVEIEAAKTKIDVEPKKPKSEQPPKTSNTETNGGTEKKKQPVCLYQNKTAFERRFRSILLRQDSLLLLLLLGVNHTDENVDILDAEPPKQGCNSDFTGEDVKDIFRNVVGNVKSATKQRSHTGVGISDDAVIHDCRFQDFATRLSRTISRVKFDKNTSALVVVVDGVVGNEEVVVPIPRASAARLAIERPTF